MRIKGMIASPLKGYYKKCMEAVWRICMSIMGLEGVYPLNITEQQQRQLYVAENGEVGDKVLNSA